MTLISAFLATIPLLIHAISAATIEHWWNISYAVANPDGVGISLLSNLVVFTQINRRIKADS